MGEPLLWHDLTFGADGLSRHAGPRALDDFSASGDEETRARRWQTRVALRWRSSHSDVHGSSLRHERSPRTFAKNFGKVTSQLAIDTTLVSRVRKERRRRACGACLVGGSRHVKADSRTTSWHLCERSNKGLDLKIECSPLRSDSRVELDRLRIRNSRHSGYARSNGRQRRVRRQHSDQHTFLAHPQRRGPTRAWCRLPFAHLPKWYAFGIWHGCQGRPVEAVSLQSGRFVA